MTREAADVLERSAADAPELAAVFYGKVRGGLFDRFAPLDVDSDRSVHDAFAAGRRPLAMAST